MDRKRGKCLLEAFDVVNKRFTVYGAPEDAFDYIGKLWSAYLSDAIAYGDDGAPIITASDVAHMMTLLKIGRIRMGVPHRDNYLDACGYMALAADMVTTPPVEDILETPEDKFVDEVFQDQATTPKAKSVTELFQDRGLDDGFAGAVHGLGLEGGFNG